MKYLLVGFMICFLAFNLINAQEKPNIVLVFLDNFGFGEPGFIRELERSGRKTLIVCGIEAHVCVLQTVLDALDRGYGVHLISDAVSSRFSHNRLAGIERMKSSGSVISTVEMFAFEAMETADHHLFRKVQKVIT